MAKKNVEKCAHPTRWMSFSSAGSGMLLPLGPLNDKRSRVAVKSRCSVSFFAISSRVRWSSSVESALLLASLRRLVRPTNVPPLPPIRSLAHFLPVIEELLAHPVPDNYLEYLRLKLRQVAGQSADVQKKTLSDDR